MTALAELCAAVAGARLSGGAGQPAGLEQLAVPALRDDSRLVQPGDLFVAVPGAKADGRRFIADAVARGAKVIVCQAPLPPEGERPAGVAFIEVPSARKALALMAARHFGAAAALCFTGVTGTNGKTTLTYLMEAILTAAGRRPGGIGTGTYPHPGRTAPAPVPTP